MVIYNLGYYLPRTGAPTPIATSAGFQNQPPITNMGNSIGIPATLGAYNFVCRPPITMRFEAEL
jgi:hypothetical protein